MIHEVNLPKWTQKRESTSFTITKKSLHHRKRVFFFFLFEMILALLAFKSDTLFQVSLVHQQATLFVLLAAGMNGRDKAIRLWGLCVKETPSESQFIDCDAFLAPWELLGEVRL